MDAEGLLSNELRQVRRRNMFVLLSTTLAIVGTRFLWWQVLPLHLRSLGATDAQVGTVFTVMLLLGPMQLVGGLVSDQMGRRYAIAIPSLALAPALIGGVLARHWLWMGLSVWFIGVIAAVQQPGFQALLAESATDSDRGRVFGTFYMTTAMASLLGPAAGAALLPVIGIRGLIGINAGSALAAGLARLLLLREGPFVAVAARSGAIPARLILRNRTMRRLIIVNSLYLLLLSLTTQGPFVALHAADSLAMQAQAILVLFTAGGIGAMLAALVGGGLADRLGGRRSGAVFLLLHALLLTIWAALRLPGPLSYALFVISWVAAQAGMVGYASWYSAFAPTAVRGRVLGLVGAVATAFSALGPQVGAWLRESSRALIAGTPGSPAWASRVASGTPFVMALVVAIVLGVLVVRMPGQQDQTGAALSQSSAEPLSAR